MIQPPGATVWGGVSGPGRFPNPRPRRSLPGAARRPGTRAPPAGRPHFEESQRPPSQVVPATAPSHSVPLPPEGWPRSGCSPSRLCCRCSSSRSSLAGQGWGAGLGEGALAHFSLPRALRGLEPGQRRLGSARARAPAARRDSGGGRLRKCEGETGQGEAPADREGDGDNRDPRGRPGEGGRARGEEGRKDGARTRVPGVSPESWGCGRVGAGGGRCPSVAAAGGRGRGVPGEEQEKEVRGSGARLGPGEPLSARSWLALRSTGSKQLPFSRLPPSLPPSPLSSLPSSSSLRPPWTWAAGWSREERDAGRQAPRGRRGCAEGGCPAAGWRAPGRGGGRRAEAADPSPRRRGRSEGEGRGGGREEGQVLPLARSLGAAGRFAELGEGLRGGRPCPREDLEV